MSATPIVIRGEESAAPRRVRSAATPAVEARRSMVHVHQGEACRPAARGPRVWPRVAGKGMAVAAAEVVAMMGMVAAWSAGVEGRAWGLRGRVGRRGVAVVVFRSGESRGARGRGAVARHAKAVGSRARRRGSSRSRGFPPPTPAAARARAMVCVRRLQREACVSATSSAGGSSKRARKAAAAGSDRRATIDSALFLYVNGQVLGRR